MEASKAESCPMNAGNGTHSYFKNSFYQREAVSVAKENMEEAIAKYLDVTQFASIPGASFRIADLGCSVGPNTFMVVQDIIEAVQSKYKAADKPEYQVFFNDHVANDFNTLFASLPQGKNYYAAGVPGSFHGRLFPESSIHFVHSSYALQWLSRVPNELLNEASPAWNKGRIHYAGAPREVVDAYKSQFTKDMENFFGAREKEIVGGGLMVLIVPGIEDTIPSSQMPSGIIFDIFSLSLLDMAKEGIIRESEVDSFNFPLYAASPQEMTDIVNENGRFDIVLMELTASRSMSSGPLNVQAFMMHLRAGFEGILNKHFGANIVDLLFDRSLKKAQEFAEQLNSVSKGSRQQLLIILKRK